MKHILLILAILTSVATQAAPLADLSEGQTGRIEFFSTTPEHRHALVNGRLGPALTVTGDLLMPTIQTEGKIPAVVFAHGSEGAAPRYYDFWARELNKAGIAVLIVDSFKPRNLDRTTGSTQLTYNITGNMSDNVHALKLLATHPKIDAARIFSMGWSMGATVVQDTAFPSYAKPILGTTNVKWAGSIALYGGCNITRRVDHNGTNQSPLLLLLAELDDNTPAANCVTYAKRLVAAGNNVLYKVYEGAYHDWDTDFNHRVNHGIFADCDIEVKITPNSGYGTAVDYKTGKTITNGTEEGAAIRSCQKMSSVIVRGNSKIRDQSLRDVLAFIKSASQVSPQQSSIAANTDSTHDQRTSEILREMAGTKK
jgi:dienelactone hydrolase